MPKNATDMDMRCSFWTTQAAEGPYSGPDVLTEAWNCWCSVDTVWQRDYQAAVQNGKEKELTIKIRDTRGEFIPDNNMTLTIDNKYFRKNGDPDGALIELDVKEVLPDLREKYYVFIKAEAVS